MSDSERRFSERAIRRKRLFLVLSSISVLIALSLTGFYSWEYATQPDFNVGIHAVLVVLILLMARLNLRQYYYAKILEKLISKQ
jgi:uncharacterized membrane protein